MRVLGALAVVTFLALCLLNGYRLEEQRIRKGQSRGRSVKLLQYGRPLSIRGLTTTSGRVLENNAFEGHWSLLIFVDPSCEPCAVELRALAKARSKLGSHMHILPILTGTPALMSAQKLASNYASRVGWPSEMAVDPNKEMSKECGHTGAIPYSVLLDPKRRVQFATSGYESGPSGSSKLANALSFFFTGKTSKNSPLTEGKYGKGRVSDVAVVLQTGERTRLSRLSRDKILIITFLNGDDLLLEKSRVTTLRQFVGTPNARFLFVINEARSKPNGLMHVGSMLLVTQRSAAAIFNAFEVKNCPTTLIVYKNRVWAEIGRGNNLDAWIEEELPYFFLLGHGNR